MKITKIECLPTSYPRSRQFITAHPLDECINAVILKIQTNEGITGIADTGDTSVWHIGESQDSILHLIQNIFGPQILLGQDPFDIEKIVAAMDYKVRQNTQAKAIVDIALHDIIGKKLGVPVFKLLGGKTIDKIPLHYVLSSGTPQSMAIEAQKVVKAGFRHVRLKVASQSILQDIENIIAVKKSINDDIKVSVDANGAWHYLQALEFLKKIESLNLAWVEQPLPWWDIDNLSYLRQQVHVPIYADESAGELSQIIELIQREAIDGFILKIQRVGGLLKAQKVLALAQANGLPVSAGCTHGSGIESAAYAHLITSNPWLASSDHGSNGPLIIHNVLETITTPITNDIAKYVPNYENGFLFPPQGSGLGVELNDDIVGNIITPGKNPVVLSS